MISKRIERKTPGTFAKLARYVAGAVDKGEKLEDFWIVNSPAGKTLDDLGLAIMEVEATQALNTRVKADKNYHLMVSFRDEQPSLESLKDMEREFAKALGFEEHPRVVATHSNTDNFHMHVAYSRIHPDTLKAHAPSHDFKARDEVCRAMERKYGLQIDHGLDEDKRLEQARNGEGKKPAAVEDMERHTWQKSFYTYVSEQKDSMAKDVARSATWQELHDLTKENYGIGFRTRGNGLVIANLHGKETIKASSIDRAFSKQSLETRLGPYQRPIERTKDRPQAKALSEAPRRARRYSPAPLFKAPGQAALWRRYAGIKRKDGTIVGKAFRTWKDFLMADALNDPYAMAVIHFYNTAFRDLGNVGKTLPDRKR